MVEDCTPEAVVAKYRDYWRDLTDEDRTDFKSFDLFVQEAWQIDRDILDPEGDYPVLPRN